MSLAAFVDAALENGPTPCYLWSGSTWKVADNQMEILGHFKHGAEPAPARPSDLRELGHGIWLCDRPDGATVRMIAGRLHTRFLDRLYLPVETHQLTDEQVLVINRFRNSIISSDPQFIYNKKVKGIFRSVIERVSGPILEVGPSSDPIINLDNPESLLCDIDEEANQANSAIGFQSVHPRELANLANTSFPLIVGCFVFHFGLNPTEAKSLVDLLDFDGAIMFNVASKSGSTRTSALSQFSHAGLHFQSFELKPVLGKSDVIFLGMKSSKVSRLQFDIQFALNNIDLTESGNQ